MRVSVNENIPVLVFVGFGPGPAGDILLEHAPAMKSIKTPVIKRIFSFPLILFPTLDIIIYKLYTFADNLSNRQ